MSRGTIFGRQVGLPGSWNKSSRASVDATRRNPDGVLAVDIRRQASSCDTPCGGRDAAARAAPLASAAPIAARALGRSASTEVACIEGGGARNTCVQARGDPSARVVLIRSATSVRPSPSTSANPADHVTSFAPARTAPTSRGKRRAEAPSRTTTQGASGAASVRATPIVPPVVERGASPMSCLTSRTRARRSSAVASAVADASTSCRGIEAPDARVIGASSMKARTTHRPSCKAKRTTARPRSLHASHVSGPQACVPRASRTMARARSVSGP